MEFRILGPLEAIQEGRPLALGAHKQRALLALLLLRRGEVVLADRLIDELWGEQPPRAAGKSVQVYVSQLRKALGDGLLETHGRGYLLRVAPQDVDAGRFERLLERGRALLAAGDARGAAATLRDALALWRGPPLADFTYEAFAQREIARLEELRLAAVEERVEADLALGRHTELVGELEALVHEHPLRERLRAQLMLALYRAGRQAEALSAYHNARRTLVDELGLEPSRELQDLERAILTQAAQLDAPRRVGLAPARRRRRTLVLATGAFLVVAAGIAALIMSLGGGAPKRSLVPVAPDSLAVIDPNANAVVGAVRVGEGPVRIAAGEGRVWVVNRDGQTVSVVDAETRTLVRTVGVAATPTDIAVGIRRAWLGDSVSHSVVALDLASATVVGRIDAPPLTPPPLPPGAAVGGAVVTGFGSVWFSSGNSTLSRIDPIRGEVRHRIRHGGLAARDEPHIAVGEGAVWVSTCCNVIERIDPQTNSVEASATAPVNGPIAAGFGSVWLVPRGDGLLWQLDSDDDGIRPVKTIRVGDGPMDVAVGAGSVWVANADGTVARVDPKWGEVTERIRVGGSLGGIAVGEGGVWVAVD